MGPEGLKESLERVESNRMAKQLVIVESPTKAKTLERYLGSDYSVAASLGHVRDLPKERMGVDLEDNFQPEYEVQEDGSSTWQVWAWTGARVPAGVR